MLMGAPHKLLQIYNDYIYLDKPLDQDGFGAHLSTHPMHQENRTAAMSPRCQEKRCPCPLWIYVGTDIHYKRFIFR